MNHLNDKIHILYFIFQHMKLDLVVLCSQNLITFQFLESLSDFDQFQFSFRRFISYSDCL